MKICYFGLYNPNFGRNKVYLTGLKSLGVEIVECRDTSPGLLKLFRLGRKHRAVLRSGGYDALVVGYPGHMLVPFAKTRSKKPVVFDALCTLHEGEILSRGKYAHNPIMRSWVEFIDSAAAKAADLILVETDAQKDYFIRRFKLDPVRVRRVYTGTSVDPSRFAEITKLPAFTAVFRGKFLPEAGVEYIIRAAKILEHSDVRIRIIGNGHLEAVVREEIEKHSPINLEWMSENLPEEELWKRVSECQIALGQFGAHERLERTIPHKAFEALALGIPYITARARGISELLTDGRDCLMVNPADPKDLADKILRLKNDKSLCAAFARNGTELYRTRFSPTVLAGELVQAINDIRI